MIESRTGGQPAARDKASCRPPSYVRLNQIAPLIISRRVAAICDVLFIGISAYPHRVRPVVSAPGIAHSAAG